MRRGNFFGKGRPLVRRWLAILAIPLGVAAGNVRAASDDNLGPGDSVRITVFEHPELTTDARVTPTGKLGFPLIGNVPVAGLSPSAAGERIAAQLQKGKYILDPQVNVSVLTVRSKQVSVLGQVGKPGRYIIDDARTSLTDILAMAGGIGSGGDDIVTLIRNRDGKTEKRDIDIPAMVRAGRMDDNFEIENGDTIFVRRAPVFYIYGEVQKAGTYRVESEMTVMQALSLGGGLTPRGTQRGIRVSRRDADGKLAGQDAKLSDKVLPDDIIQVKESLF